MATHFIDWHTSPPIECQQGAVCIGNFDGVHPGHVALIEEAQRQAQLVNGPAVALTFDPHPLQLLRPTSFPPILTQIEDRATLLQAHGADEVVVLQTDSDFLHLNPEEFFQRILCEQFQVKAMIEGRNFGFGRGRAGNIDTLKTLCNRNSIPLQIVDPIEIDNESVSSSRIRGCLEQGNVSHAAKLLGRPYKFQGIVVQGDRRGATIGFPTANVESIHTLIPKEGVYAGIVQGQNKTYLAATNIGPNPTFGVAQKKVEIHLLDFDENLYGQTLTFEFHAHLRDIQTFPNVEQLTTQLDKDIQQTRAMLNLETEKTQS